MSVALVKMGGMDLLSPTLGDLLVQVSAVVQECATQRMIERASETDLARQISMIGAVGRLVEALTVDAVGEVMRRSESAARDERMTSHFGCRDVSELVQTLTRVDPRTAARLQRAAKVVRPAVSDTTGELLDPPFACVREAMTDGILGVDGILAVCEPLQTTAPSRGSARPSASARSRSASPRRRACRCGACCCPRSPRSCRRCSTRSSHRR